MIDLIGDIHGYAAELEKLLLKLGYKEINGIYSHPERKILFIGDYIDRGPEIRKTLKIVKGMVDNGHAIALMGNHEYNALCFHFNKKDGGHLRKHSIKNIIQHFDTIKQFQNLQNEYEMYLEWFKTLPLYFESESFRAVHACWDNSKIDYLKQVLEDDRLTDELIYQSITEGTELFDAIEITLKGKELKMPKGLSFKDNDGEERTEIRIKWWENPSNMTYRSISIENNNNLPNKPIDFEEPNYYSIENKVVFFGHYWLKNQPSIFKKNICCLDYSIAKEGLLVAYRFDGEKELDNSKFVFVKKNVEKFEDSNKNSPKVNLSIGEEQTNKH